MKQTVMIVGLILVVSRGFSQNKITVMLEQIAKYEVYLMDLKKGYDVVNKGLTLINDIKHGEFDLHRDYFNSLKSVNPQIKSEAKIAAMIALQAEILSDCQSYYHQLQQSGVFTSQEISYLYTVFSALLTDVAKDITAVTTVIADGQLQMKDGERLSRIDQLYAGMTDHYEFLHAFGDQAKLQGLQRRKALQEVQNLQKMY
ncbi:MAG TPA: hypothetical protein VK518_00145 [Puia sp.]|nr:hypothetical protein [Puia sp.]